MNASDLPPIPDPITGEPRPPRAPRIETRIEHTCQDREPRNPPPPPPSEIGPMLEWIQPSVRTQYTVAALTAGLLAAFGTLRDGGFGWLQMWGAWVILLFFSWMMFRAARNYWTAAGATWVQWRSRWVDTYHLTRIRFSADGYSRVLRLKDAHGNEIHSFKISEIQGNPDLWDLVYNGILHSVASGNCDIDAKTRRILQIPYELGPRPTGKRADRRRLW